MNDSKSFYIHLALERSFSKLNAAYIDLYHHHRNEPNVPIEMSFRHWVNSQRVEKLYG